MGAIHCVATMLAKAMRDVEPIISARSPAPALSMVLIQAHEDGHVSLCGVGRQCSIRRIITGASADIPMRALAPPGKLSQVASSAGGKILDIESTIDKVFVKPPKPKKPARRTKATEDAEDAEDEIPEVEVTRHIVRVSGTRMKFDLIGEDAALFPGMPDWTEPAEVRCMAGSLRDAIAHVMLATSSGSADFFMFKGILVELMRDTILFSATDRVRMCRTSVPCRNARGIKAWPQVVLPKSVCVAMLRLITDPDEEVGINLDKSNNIIFNIHGTIVAPRLLDGEYPAGIFKLLDEPEGHRAEITAGTLRDCITVASVICNEEWPAITLRLDEGYVEASAAAGEMGRSLSRLVCDYRGDPISIFIHSRFMLDGLAPFDRDERVSIEVGTEGRHVIFRKSDVFAYALAPMVESGRGA
jgi:DNA polymerase III sliding clamp (beta) subunit (PCNA family)